MSLQSQQMQTSVQQSQMLQSVSSLPSYNNSQQLPSRSVSYASGASLQQHLQHQQQQQHQQQFQQQSEGALFGASPGSPAGLQSGSGSRSGSFHVAQGGASTSRFSQDQVAGGGVSLVSRFSQDQVAGGEGSFAGHSGGSVGSSSRFLGIPQGATSMGRSDPNRKPHRRAMSVESSQGRNQRLDGHVGRVEPR